MKVASKESFCALTFMAIKTTTHVTTVTTNAVKYARFLIVHLSVQERQATLNWIVTTVVISTFAIISAKTATVLESACSTSLFATSDINVGKRIVFINVIFVKDSASSPITSMKRAY